MLSYTQQLFEQNRNAEFAKKMKQYMRNQYDFYGIKAPLRKQLLKEIEVQEGRLEGEELIAFVQAAWDNPHREFQHLAMDRMDKVKRKLDLTFLPYMEQWILQKSWWDTVDWLAVNGVGSILSRHPEVIPEYSSQWMASDNIWLQRTAILFQLKYREKTNMDLLFSNILQIADSKEFFLQKAAGWALREQSKRVPELIAAFIDSHDLKPLTVREGRKYL